MQLRNGAHLVFEKTNKDNLFTQTETGSGGYNCERACICARACVVDLKSEEKALKTRTHDCMDSLTVVTDFS